MRASSERRGRRMLLTVLGLVAVALCAAVPASAGAVNYVSLGDSYTSGPGILPYAPTAPAACGQSEKNYPHLVAAALGLSLKDVSCGGAKTEDEKVSQLEGQPPQFEALSASTEVVTLGMGGNDGNLFGTLLNGCTQIDLIEQAPGKAPCEAHYASFVTSTFAADKGPQEEGLKEIHLLAPKAKIFVVGYPEIVEATASCPGFPWHAGDLKWFRDKVQKLGNKMIEAGAKANGATFVNTFKPSEGHNSCKNPPGSGEPERWIEPLIGSLTGVAVHPNALGEQNDAYDVELAMLKAGIR